MQGYWRKLLSITSKADQSDLLETGYRLFFFYPQLPVEPVRNNLNLAFGASGHTLDVRYGPVASYGVLYLPTLLSKQVKCKAKTSFPLRAAFSDALFSFDPKIPSISDLKKPTSLISLAAAMITVTFSSWSCVCFLVQFAAVVSCFHLR